MEDQFSNYLELASHVALFGVAVVVAWSYWQPVDSSPRSKTSPIHVDSSKVLRRWQPAEQQIFLFVSPTCPYCDRSMDFYARLGQVVDSLQRTGAPVTLAAVIDGADSPRAQRQVLQNAGVSIDTLLTLSSRSLIPVGVTGVPTVSIQKPGGAAPSTWEGLQDSTGEQEILSAVRRLGTIKDQISE
jgi:hypothetical protein